MDADDRATQAGRPPSTVFRDGGACAGSSGRGRCHRRSRDRDRRAHRHRESRGRLGPDRRAATATAISRRNLDVQADAILRRCLGKLPIAALASEEMHEPQISDRAAKICVAIDPLDGSSNIDINMTVGTIFSIRPAPDDLALAFHQRGSAQLAAGFVTYGPQTSLVLTLGDGVDIFTLDRKSGCFRLARSSVQISEVCDEFAINASNRRHWDPPVRAFVDECLAGVDGLANHDFNMRWIGSLVAEAYRILTRGGVFLYPSDARPGYGDGRLRLTLRGPSDGDDHRAGRRLRLDRTRAHPRPVGGEPAPARAADHGIEQRGAASSRNCTAIRCSSPASPRRCSRGAASSGCDGRRFMSRKHPDHLHHRLLGRRHDLGQEDVRADILPRTRQRRLHRGRRFPSLRPHRDAHADGQGG